MPAQLQGKVCLTKSAALAYARKSAARQRLRWQAPWQSEVCKQAALAKPRDRRDAFLT